MFGSGTALLGLEQLKVPMETISVSIVYYYVIMESRGEASL